MMNFLMQIENMALIALVLVTGVALFLPTLSTLIMGGGVSPTEATTWINRKKAQILDVRPEADFQAGHLPNSKRIAEDQIASGIDKLKLDRKLPVIVVCQSNVAARGPIKTLQSAGFAEVKNLDGGVQAWTTAGLPLVKS
jgi:rhodanese-related sulfurtransferase